MAKCKNDHEFQFPAYKWDYINHLEGDSPGTLPALVPVCPTCGVRV